MTSSRKGKNTSAKLTHWSWIDYLDSKKYSALLRICTICQFASFKAGMILNCSGSVNTPGCNESLSILISRYPLQFKCSILDSSRFILIAYWGLRCRECEKTKSLSCKCQHLDESSKVFLCRWSRPCIKEHRGIMYRALTTKYYYPTATQGACGWNTILSVLLQLTSPMRNMCLYIRRTKTNRL